MRIAEDQVYPSCFDSFEHLVPAQGVLSHDRSADHLARTASALAARHTGTSSEDGTGAGALAHLLGSGAGALVQLLSLAVTTGNPEHTGTVGSGTGNDTNTNADGARLGLGGVGRAVSVAAALGATTVAARSATAARG